MPTVYACARLDAPRRRGNLLLSEKANLPLTPLDFREDLF
jgi:hypothetical protein